jgi:shikimate kinase
MNPDPPRPIALVGLMGSGKSAVAAELGERLAVAVADLDAMLEAETGSTIAQLFAREGEPEFRRRERELFARVLSAGAGVIACGGGLVLGEAERAQLKARCHTVWLEVSPGQAAARIGADATERPLLKGGAIVPRLAALLTERGPLYAEVAELRVPTDGRTVAQVAGAVLAALGPEAIAR